MVPQKSSCFKNQILVELVASELTRETLSPAENFRFPLPYTVAEESK